MTASSGKHGLSLILAALMLWVQSVSLAHLHAEAPAEPVCLACALADHGDTRLDSAAELALSSLPTQAARRADTPSPPETPTRSPNSRAPPAVA